MLQKGLQSLSVYHALELALAFATFIIVLLTYIDKHK
ncbi:putative holin-like toxin [Lactobacillus sp. ESL0225]|nr:putative holin-like toxin [Lactobacillus sp. ESL0228]RMC47884.1 putative holin-like toxin [Lactobacillus sp. ESL0225]